jgi:uncharacterized DUF497 family protein
MTLRFVWDPRKARSNQRKHGVEFPEATTVFDDSLSVTISDPDRSAEEQRFPALGTPNRRGLLVVAHVETGDSIRIASARRANRRERRIYTSQSGVPAMREV